MDVGLAVLDSFFFFGCFKCRFFIVFPIHTQSIHHLHILSISRYRILITNIPS